MWQATYLAKPNCKRKIVHELGIFEFHGGVAQNVPDELGKFLRHITTNGEANPGFFTVDMGALAMSVIESRVEVPLKKKKKKKKLLGEKKTPVPYDREKFLVKKAVKKLREA